MKIYKGKYNLFKKLEPITNMKQELNIIKDAVLISNSYPDFEIKKLFKLFEDYENSQKYNYKKKEEDGKIYNSRYGMYLEILLPDDFPIDEVSNLSNRILPLLIKDEKINIPVFSHWYTKGQGRFLRFTIFLREYYKEERVVSKKVAKKTMYKDTRTKRYCDKDNPCAVKVASPGDVLSEKKSKFSTKVNWFRYTKPQFDSFMNSLSDVLLNFFKELNLYIENSYYTNRYDINVYSPKKEEGIKLANNYLKELDRKVHELEDNMSVFPDMDFEKSLAYISLCNYIHDTFFYHLKTELTFNTQNASLFKNHIRNYIETNRPILEDRFIKTENAIFENFEYNFG